MSRTKTDACPPLLRTDYAISLYSNNRIFRVPIVSETDKTLVIASKGRGRHGMWHTTRRMKSSLTTYPSFEAAKAEAIRRAEKTLEIARAAVPKAEAALAAAKELAEAFDSQF